MNNDEIQPYLNLTRASIEAQLRKILERQLPLPGKSQVDFTAVETLLCYGLFPIVDPHSYGGANMHRLPSEVTNLAAFFRRSPGSVTSKMLNLDGSRKNGARAEPLLFATLSDNPDLYFNLYKDIIQTARDIAIDQITLPDFLNYFDVQSEQAVLLGQDELSVSTTTLLKGKDTELEQLDHSFKLGPILTERMVERKIRLAQHRFARAVLLNCNNTCVFCGFQPSTLPTNNGLLIASHIKPWAVSTDQERIDLRNGLTACPTHDAAFDRGYLTVNGGYRIHKAPILQQSLAHDQGVIAYFGPTLRTSLILPATAKPPHPTYLAYHRENIFKA